MKRRLFLWLRAWTDKHLVREQLVITLLVDSRMMYHADSLTMMAISKYEGGVGRVEMNINDHIVLFMFQCEPVVV